MSDLVASVVVPTVGRRDSLVRLLEALSHQSLPADRFEVVVVLDGAEDGTEEYLRRTVALPGLICVPQPRSGRASACNRGIEVARAPLIVLLDDDMEPTTEWLEAHVEAHEGAVRRCVLGAVPIRLHDDSSPLERWVARTFEEHHDRQIRTAHEFFFRDFYTGNASIRRDVLLEVGCFDTGFRVYGHEDLELFARLREAGVTPVFDARACAWQEYRKTFAGFVRDSRHAGMTAVLLAQKHPEVARELVQFRDHGRAWRGARALLGSSLLPGAVLAHVLTLTERALRRVAPKRLTLFYILNGDLFFWIGAADADPLAARRLRALAEQS